MENERPLKDILADSLAHYRKEAGLTQLELAEKLNYSDKAVSKWERGESAPDVFVLSQIAEIFNITVNDLLQEGKITVKQRNRQFRTIVTLLSAGIVWLLAVIAFVFTKLIDNQNTLAYLAFIYAIPVSAIVVLVFSGVWKKRLYACISISAIIWGLLLSLFLSIHTENIWLVFILGIPMQILTILWYMLKFDFKKIFKKKNPASKLPNENKQ